MLSSLILAAALAGQAPAAKVPPRPTPAVAPSADKAASARMIARRKSKKVASYAAQRDREAAEAQAAAKAAEAAKKEYKEMLPYMLENQRQMLERQSAAERNAALNRAASAMERQAGYVYPGQSPTVGPYPR